MSGLLVELLVYEREDVDAAEEDEDKLEDVEDERELEVTEDEVELEDGEGITLDDKAVVLGGMFEEVDEGVEIAGLDEVVRDDEVEVLGEMLEDIEDMVGLTELEDVVLDDEAAPLRETLEEVDDVVEFAELAELCEIVVELVKTTGLDELEVVCATLLEEVTVLWLVAPIVDLVLEDVEPGTPEALLLVLLVGVSDCVIEELRLDEGELIVKDNVFDDIVVEELMSNELDVDELTADERVVEDPIAEVLREGCTSPVSGMVAEEKAPLSV
ncbi:hypothetical protein KC349_g730 [Hortaea werneckii]|nr:hypothetical protein KC349_g730 [Hortaea werneckii]